MKLVAGVAFNIVNHDTETANKRTKPSIHELMLQKSRFHIRSFSTIAKTRIMAQSSASKPIPEGFQPHTERGATILMPASAPDAFINPIQEFNRDLSVACIKQWSVLRESELRAKWIKKREGSLQQGRVQVYKKALKLWTREKDEKGDAYTEAMPTLEDVAESEIGEYKCPKYTVLEALSATGLRSIRYAQELPNVG
jgi:tRNA (guanine26-N2/guanine27-N2)-dimethyltransferase